MSGRGFARAWSTRDGEGDEVALYRLGDGARGPRETSQLADLVAVVRASNVDGVYLSRAAARSLRDALTVVLDPTDQGDENDEDPPRRAPATTTAPTAAVTSTATTSTSAAGTGRRGADRPLAPTYLAGLALPAISLALTLAAGVVTGQLLLALAAVAVPVAVTAAGLALITRRTRARSAALAAHHTARDDAGQLGRPLHGNDPTRHRLRAVDAA